jgi:hypothetical protein
MYKEDPHGEQDEPNDGLEGLHMRKIRRDPA